MKAKIIIFDMDGVLVDTESSWRFVHQKLNTDNEANFRRYVDGEIDYREFLKRDVALWKDLHVNDLRDILSQVPLMKGSYSTISQLKTRGYTTAIVSSGVGMLAERVKNELGIDHAYANEISVDEKGMLVAKETDTVVELLNKIKVCRRFAADNHVTFHDCAVVGDSVFDIPLFNEAGLSIAFNSTDRRVTEAADVAVKGKDLTGILRFLR